MGADFSLVGRTEEIVGRWLKGKRDKFIIATKGAAPAEAGTNTLAVKK